MERLFAGWGATNAPLSLMPLRQRVEHVAPGFDSCVVCLDESKLRFDPGKPLDMCLIFSHVV